MTNNKTYPVSTKIIYCPLHACDEALKDKGKIGVIAALNPADGQPNIFLPQSEHISLSSTKQIPVSWETLWRNIKILSLKNQQLLFSFME